MAQVPIDEGFKIHTDMLNVLGDKVDELEKKVAALTKDKSILINDMNILNTKIKGGLD